MRPSGLPIGLESLLIYCSTAFIIRTFFEEESPSKLSKNQLMALLPVAITSARLYYVLLCDKDEKNLEKN